jgi:hypothetical protein
MSLENVVVFRGSHSDANALKALLGKSELLAAVVDGPLTPDSILGYVTDFEIHNEIVGAEFKSTITGILRPHASVSIPDDCAKRVRTKLDLDAESWRMKFIRFEIDLSKK